MSLHPKLDDLLELRHQARALGVAANHLVNSTFSGLYASVFRGTGLDFDEVREYREGDDIRNMDWLVTARTNVPHLKVFREERQRNVFLCIDSGPHMSFGTRGTFKSIQAARTAALIGWAASKQHDRVGGVLFGNPATGIRYYRPTPGRRGLWPVANLPEEALLQAVLMAELVTQNPEGTGGITEAARGLRGREALDEIGSQGLVLAMQGVDRNEEESRFAGMNGYLFTITDDHISMIAYLVNNATSCGHCLLLSQHID